MALFESYERRINQILPVLNKYGINSVEECLDICKENEINNVYLDLMLDGRDTYEKSALTYLDNLQEKLDEIGLGKIATISGRYYGMDRDNNFDRLKLSYDAMVYGKAEEYDNYTLEMGK